MTEGKLSIGARISLVIGLVITAALGIRSLFIAFPDFFAIWTDGDMLRQYVEGFGVRAPVAFVALQAFQVIVAPIPGEFTGAVAGLLFGGLKGTWLATIGLAIGSFVAFLLGRLVGRPLVKLMVPAKEWERFSFVAENKQLLVVFVVFLIPGFPKDVLTYLFSLGKIGAWRFAAVSQVARLPGTVMLAYGGNALFAGDWVTIAWLGVASSVVALAGYLRRHQLIAWLKN